MMSEGRNKMDRKCWVQFAVVVKKGQVAAIGKSAVMTPIPHHTGGGIKWFDDTKLIRGGDAV